MNKKPRIVAIFMCHYEDEFIDDLLKDLSKYTKEFYVNLNEPSQKVYDAVSKHPYTKKFILTQNSEKRDTSERRWDQGLQRENTIRLLDDVKPDIVLFPDADEIYCNNLDEQLVKFWEDENKKTFWFRLFYMWGDKKHFRNDGLYKKIHHVRIYKWQPGINYLPYPGYACPRPYISLPRDTRFQSDMGIKHYGYVFPETRQKRFLRDGVDYLQDKEYRKMKDANPLLIELPKEML